MAISLNGLDARNGVEASGDEVDGSRGRGHLGREIKRNVSWPKMRMRRRSHGNLCTIRPLNQSRGRDRG